MKLDRYYIVEIEEFDFEADEPWRTERQGLFKSFRDASEWLIDEGFSVYAQESFIEGEYYLQFYIDSYMGSESYEALIEEWFVK